VFQSAVFNEYYPATCFLASTTDEKNRNVLPPLAIWNNESYCVSEAAPLHSGAEDLREKKLENSTDE
jgi:hypothetical protein